MAIADTITSMQNHTSNAYTMIGYGTDLTGINKNLENLSSTIFEAFLESLRDSTTLYTNLPKISGNGTQITLNDTANAPMRITLKASELSQDATPTPDNPQDIHTISGNNSVVVNGKNLCNYDVNTNLTHDYLDSSGNWFTGNDYYVNQKIYINSNKISIYVGQRHGAYANIRLGQFKSDGTFITRTLITATTNNITLDNNCSYIWVSIDKGTEFYFDNIAIVYGTTAYYEPYVSQTAPINLPVENLLENTLVSGTKNGITYIVNEDKSVTLNGTATSLTWIILNRAFTYEVGDYTISFNPTEVVSGLAIYSDPFGVVPENRTISITETTTKDVSLRITSGITLNNVIVYPQIEKGTKANSYTPYGTTPIEYCKIGNYEDEFILTSGKNEFDGNYLDAIVGADGKFSDNSTTKTAEIKVEPNTTYSIKKFTNTGIGTRFLVVESATKLSNNQSGTFIYSSNSATEYSYTTGATTNYMYVYVTNDTTSIPYLMVVKGSTIPTSYEPYGTNQWYLKKNIGKVVLDGSESWGINPSWNYTNTNIYMLNTQPKTTNQVISDYFLYKSNTFAVDTDGLVGQVWGDTLSFRISNILANDIEAFKTWLSTHNTRLYYILNTPTYTQITGTLETQLNNIHKNMLSYKGTTNVSQINNDLPFVLGVSALEDLS